MREVDEVQALAGRLFDFAGGTSGSKSQYFRIIGGGGSTELVGMSVSPEQLESWRELSPDTWEMLASHSRDEQMAYGSFFYSKDTLVRLLDEVSGDVPVVSV